MSARLTKIMVVVNVVVLCALYVLAALWFHRGSAVSRPEDAALAVAEDTLEEFARDTEGAPDRQADGPKDAADWFGGGVARGKADFVLSVFKGHLLAAQRRAKRRAILFYVAAFTVLLNAVATSYSLLCISVRENVEAAAESSSAGEATSS